MNYRDALDESRGKCSCCSHTLERFQKKQGTANRYEKVPEEPKTTEPEVKVPEKETTYKRHRRTRY